jgi:hypothetical protein
MSVRFAAVQVTTELEDNGWRRARGVVEVSGWYVNRWRRGPVVLTVAWVSDTEVSHAFVEVADGAKRQISLRELLPLVCGPDGLSVVPTHVGGCAAAVAAKAAA